jgi:hypothetical protein
VQLDSGVNDACLDRSMLCALRGRGAPGRRCAATLQLVWHGKSQEICLHAMKLFHLQLKPIPTCELVYRMHRQAAATAHLSLPARHSRPLLCLKGLFCKLSEHGANLM